MPPELHPAGPANCGSNGGRGREGVINLTVRPQITGETVPTTHLLEKVWARITGEEKVRCDMVREAFPSPNWERSHRDFILGRDVSEGQTRYMARFICLAWPLSHGSLGLMRPFLVRDVMIGCRKKCGYTENSRVESSMC
jgi:hypothetical protein